MRYWWRCDARLLAERRPLVEWGDVVFHERGFQCGICRRYSNHGFWSKTTVLPSVAVCSEEILCPTSNASFFCNPILNLSLAPQSLIAQVLKWTNFCCPWTSWWEVMQGTGVWSSYRPLEQRGGVPCVKGCGNHRRTWDGEDCVTGSWHTASQCRWTRKNTSLDNKTDSRTLDFKVLQRLVFILNPRAWTLNANPMSLINNNSQWCIWLQTAL